MGWLSRILVSLGLAKRPARELEASFELAASQAPPPPPPKASAAATSPSQEKLRAVAGNMNFGNVLAEHAINHLKSEAHRAKEEGDKMLFAALLRAVQNDGIDLPAMPEAVLQIQRALRSPTCDITRLAHMVEREPVIAVKIVSMANAAFYGARTRVTNLREAVTRIGLRQAAALVTAIVAQSKLFRIPNDPEASARLYRHAVATALCYQVIAGRLGFNRDVAFLVGLVHDLGELFILAQAAEVYRTTRGKSPARPETVRYLVDELHGLIGAMVAEAWKFDRPVVEAIRHHPRPEGAPLEARVLAQALNLADRIAEIIHAGEDGHAQGIEAELAPRLAALRIPELFPLLSECSAAMDAFEGPHAAAGPASHGRLQAITSPLAATPTPTAPHAVSAPQPIPGPISAPNAPTVPAPAAPEPSRKSRVSYI